MHKYIGGVPLNVLIISPTMIMEKKKISKLIPILLGITIVLYFLCIDYSEPGLKDILITALVVFNIILFMGRKLKK